MFALFLIGLGSALAQPAVRDTLAVDTVRAAGAEAAWVYRVVEVEDDTEAWVEVEDPFGGTTRTPVFFHHVIGESAREVRDGLTPRVNINLPEPAFYTALGLLVAALALLTLLPVLVYRRRYYAERAERERLQEMRRQLAESREDERRRLARDLHDGPLQDLHALHMQLGLAADGLAADGLAPSDTLLRRLRGAQDETHTVVGDLRRMTEALRPPALGPFGLAAALRTHADRFRQRHPGVDVDLDLANDGLVLPEPTRLVLFRIAQEAMNNAVKHGSPTRLTVSFGLTTSEAVLVVEDDGPGFDGPLNFDALAADGHFGLLGMQERADSVSGSLTVSNDGAPGFRVQVAVPRVVVDGQALIGEWPRPRRQPLSAHRGDGR